MTQALPQVYISDLEVISSLQKMPLFAPQLSWKHFQVQIFGRPFYRFHVNFLLIDAQEPRITNFSRQAPPKVSQCLEQIGSLFSQTRQSSPLNFALTRYSALFPP